MLAPLSRIDFDYQLWRNGIPYVKWLMDEMNFDEFSETCLMPTVFKVCILSFLVSFLFSLHFYTW